MATVRVLRPSGDHFEVELPRDRGQSVRSLKAAIAEKTKVAVTRQRLLLGHELLSDETLGQGIGKVLK